MRAAVNSIQAIGSGVNRRRDLGAVVVLALALALPAHAQPDAEQAEKDAEARAATFGLGAIVGVATYNMVTTVASAGVTAASVTMVGVAGAVGASTAMIWMRNTYNGERTDYAQLVPVSLGALAGVVTGDVLASSLLGFSPFATAAGGVLPNFGFSVGGIASSLYVYSTGLLGARVADAKFGVPEKPLSGPKPLGPDEPR